MTHHAYIIVSEFAKKVGVTRQGVHKAIKSGRIKHFKRVGPIVLIHPSEIKKFKEAHHGK